MRVHIDPPDDHEDRAPTPLGVKVRYAIAMGAFLLVAIFASVAFRNTSDLSTTSHKAATLARANTKLTHEVSRIANANTRLAHRLAADEHRTCVIQRRGLPAGHQLAATMKYIYVLLTLPPTPGAAATPPKIEKLVLALDSHLARYLQAEAKQPETRSCVTR